MSWVRIESAVARHRKFQQAGPAAAWLWICGLAYCQDSLTDGFIPLEALPYLGVKAPTHSATRLMRAGLWDACEGGWRVHDYLNYQKSAAVMNNLVEDRRVAGAAGGKASGVARRSQTTDTKQPAEANAKQTSEATLKQTRSKPEANAKQPANPDQNRSDQNRSEQSGERARAGAPIHATHKKHAVCGRICVPADLHSEFVRRRNHPDADTELRGWYLVVDREWLDGPFANQEPGDAFAFWKARYDEQWPAPQKAKSIFGTWRPPEAV